MFSYLQKCTKKQLYEFFDEFGGTEESVKNDVEYIKEWLQQQPHLPNVDDDELLTNILLRCKNSVEKMKHVLENWYTVKAQFPEIYKNRDLTSKEFEESVMPVLPLRKLTPEGYQVFILSQPENFDDIILTGHGFLKSSQIISFIHIKYFFNRGTIFILDFKMVKASDIAMMFSILNKLIWLTFNTVPLRIVKFYVLNLSPIAVPLLNMAKSIVKKKLRDRFVIWSEKETDLVNVISKDVLPAIYGGNEKPMDELRRFSKNATFSELHLDALKSCQEWINSDEKHKADLSKKPSNNPLSDQSLFGIDGSFRKIAID